MPFVQGAAANGNSTSTATTSSLATTSGNTMIATVGHNTSGTTMTVSDNKGNTWTAITAAQTAGAFQEGRMFMAKNIIGGAGHTFTITDSGTSISVAIAVQEFSLIDVSAGIDKSVVASDTSGGSSALASGSTASTTWPDEIVVGGGISAGGGTFTLGAGFTNLNSSAVFGTTGVGQESKIVSATGTQSAAMSNSQTGNWIMFAVTLKVKMPPSFRQNKLRPAIFKPGIAR